MTTKQERQAASRASAERRQARLEQEAFEAREEHARLVQNTYNLDDDVGEILRYLLERVQP